MTVVSLVVGLTRTGLILLPLIALQLTALDDQAAVGLSFLFTFQLWKGIGYDIISHYFGWEANLYLMALLLIKAVPFITIEYEALYVWLPLLAVELIYTIGVNTRYRRYFDEWRFSARADVEFRGEEADKRRGKVRSSDETFEAISWRNVLLLAFIVSAFNGARAFVMWYHTGAEFDSVANDYDSLLFWSFVFEGGVALIMVLRLRSLYTPHQDDFWKDVGGILVIYMWYQGAVGWILPSAALIALTYSMIAAVFVACLMIERQVTHAHAKRAEFLGQVVVQWFYKAMDLAFSEPVGQIQFILLTSAIAFFMRDVWFTTTIYFAYPVTRLTCAAQGFMDGPIQQFFLFLDNPKYAGLLVVPAIYLSRVRIKLRRIIFLVYPYLQAGCSGAIAAVTPIYATWTIPFFALTWLVALLIMLQVFPEAQRITTKSTFWILAFVASLSSFFVVQLVGDGTVSFWYLLDNDNEFSRSYSDTGYWALAFQIMQMILCVSMYNHKVDDEKARRETSKGPSSSTSKIATSAWSLLNQITSPLYVFGGAAALLVVAIYTDAPVDDMSIVKIDSTGPPQWLRNTTNALDAFGGDDTSLALMFSRSLIKAAAVVGIVNFLFQQVCWDTPTGELCLDDVLPIAALGNLTLFVDEAVADVAHALIVALNKSIPGNILTDVTQTLAALPALNGIENLQIFNVPHIELPSLHIPSWLPYLATAFAILTVVVAILAFVVGHKFTAVLRVLQSILVSLFVSAIVFLVGLYGWITDWGFQLTIVWSEGIWIYALALVCLAVAVVLAFIGQDELAQEKLELVSASTESRWMYALRPKTLDDDDNNNTRSTEEGEDDEEDEEEEEEDEDSDKGERVVTFRDK
jgi:hypothetical protein